MLYSILDLKKVLQQAETTISEKNQEIETCIKQGKNLGKEIKSLEKNLKDSKHKVQCSVSNFFCVCFLSGNHLMAFKLLVFQSSALELI